MKPFDRLALRGAYRRLLTSEDFAIVKDDLMSCCHFDTDLFVRGEDGERQTSYLLGRRSVIQFMYRRAKMGSAEEITVTMAPESDVA